MTLNARLNRWYEAHGRKELPWRRADDAYCIWVSEIMLQQTQVKTVLERFYEPFLEAFSTIEALANAPQDAVLKRWQGLGYYNRAINLHNAAKMVVEQFDGNLPDNVDELMTLPGIGKNTAHAIAALAFRKPVGVMEANVKRVLSRMYALEHPADKTLWERAGELVDKKDPFTHNQAMMDIGALLCAVKAPLCDKCPLSSDCEGKIDPTRYPAKKAKKQTPIRKRLILVYEKGDTYHLAPRKTRFLNGLYGFVEEKELIAPMDATYLGDVKQTYSHFQLQAKVYRVAQGKVKNAENQWFTKDEIASLPLSKADEKVVALLK